MAIEFIGAVTAAGPTQGQVPAGSDSDYPVQAASLLEDAGFDKLLIGHSASAADGMLIANEVLTTTSALGVVVTQVPGLVAPTVAARQYATLAAFHPARVGLHAVGDAADGGVPPEGTSGSRAGEFLEVVQLAWHSRRPFDYAGAFYRVTGAYSDVRPAVAGGVPLIYFSGRSPSDVLVGAAEADVYLLAAGSPAAVASRIAIVNSVATQYGRSPRFGVSLRLDADGGAAPVWMPSGIQAASGEGAAEPIRLAGSYDQLAQSLLEYIETGVSTLVIEHDPQVGAADCAEVIHRVRAATDCRRRLVI
jgi:alkanesulfonate monooxygenase